MPPRDPTRQSLSRRSFLSQISFAPVLFLPASVRNSWFRHPGLRPGDPLASAETFLKPHYPANSPLDDTLRFAIPGSDEYVSEAYVAEIATILAHWSRQLKFTHPTAEIPDKFVHPTVKATAFAPVRETALRKNDPIEAVRREFSPELFSGRERFLAALKNYFSGLQRIDTADFEIHGCTWTGDSPLSLDISLRYDFVGTCRDGTREERIGNWHTRWLRVDSSNWQAAQWTAMQETVCRSAGPIFFDISSHVLGECSSYHEQLQRGSDYWRTVLDGAIGVDVYGNNGVAVGDFDNDGLDDLYICQPAGLPNRLYRNRGDGTFEDVSEEAGVGVLDFTACALFADFQNRGLQDLLVVCATGPLLFVNDGRGKFSLKGDAFRFNHPPQGAFTHAAAADYDRDGRLDVYFCLYNYYQGLDQYRYPVPYFDARNGPPNFLFHNEGNGIFHDRTEAVGLNAENDRYSFACCWGDSNGNGWPDLYVVNDFGRNSLYRNNGNGTFTAVSHEAHVDEAGAGMSACWLDFDNGGKQDIYAAGMWVAAGMRIFEDPHFHSGEPETIRNLYRRHMSGNSLYRNLGDGTFQNVAGSAGVEMGRWSWATDAWDFDNDGYPDLYVANGYISGDPQKDVSSFFWRQVVAKSPSDATPSPDYERGWGAINELIRSDATWNGRERNVFFANNRDGTFCDVSGVVGMDFRDDSRTFSLADFDGDGHLEIVLKNRNAPQVRILRLAMEGLGNSISFRLRGEQSNRDAIGAAVTVEAGSLRQMKYLRAGSGFLSQHTKELFFGVGAYRDLVHAVIHWPNGFVQHFDALPVNHRIEIVEGKSTFKVKPFAATPARWARPGAPATEEVLPQKVSTWLIDPVPAPQFSLPDLAGNLRDLRSFDGSNVLLNFWRTDASACREQLRALQNVHLRLASTGLRVAAMNLDDPTERHAVGLFAATEHLTFPILLADSDTAGIYNIVYRYLFSRHRDLPLPTSFLIDAAGKILKVYQGICTEHEISEDLRNIPAAIDQRLRRALPFPGTLFQDAFRRNSFTYGVAYFQHGFLEQAARSFQQVIAENPGDAEACYNLGTVFLRRNLLTQAKKYLDQAVRLRPEYPEAWNNLGMIAAQQGADENAIANFQKSLEQRPSYVTAQLNLGNLYRRRGDVDNAEKLLKSALAGEPQNPDVNYSLGMIYARRGDTEKAVQFLQTAIRLRPVYFDALNNLGVLFVQARQYPQAEEEFRQCIREAPDFDQAYLNLARLLAMLNQKEQARSVLQDLLQKQPQHKIARQMLQMLY